MIRMILTDLDHTLLREDGSVSPETVRVIAACRAKGVLFAIATARYWIGAERYIELLRPDYEITTDGTLVTSQDRCVYSCAFSERETAFLLRRLLRETGGAEITVAVGKQVYWNSRHIAESAKLHKAVYNDYSEDLHVNANKIVAGLPDEGIARRIANEAGCGLQCYRGEKWYAFLPRGAGKTTAVRSLAQACGIGMEEIAAFGDDSNDIDMLKACGTGIAVANAVPEALAAADAVTLSNEEDGVARWLKDHLL